jgi:hypothetical protein
VAERFFFSWSQLPLRELAGPVAVRTKGRLQATQPLTVSDLSGGDPRTGGGKFELFGPGDAVRPLPSTITRRYPAPGAHDAEETKAALVELEPEDLPWRYSPEVPGSHDVPPGSTGLRPWLVLVLGTSGPGELSFAPDGRVGLGDTVQRTHPLHQSWRWAHVHEVPGGTAPQRIARILSPRDMLPQTDYTACLVPAFVLRNDDVSPAWPENGGPTVWLPCYDSWSFRTGDAGDFPQLASLLEVASFGPDSTFGVASVIYDRRGAPGPGQHAEEPLPTHGAMRRPADTDPPPVDDDIAKEVTRLTEPLRTPAGRWILTAPSYPEPFGAPGAAPPPGGWASELAADPRRRGSAGLGAWAAIAWQDRIADAAVQRGGDLAIVRDRVNHLTLGVEASRALWRRHVPSADPSATLAVLGPALGRLPATTPAGEVADTLSLLAGRTPLFDRALWSSAARRALRPGPARTSLAQPGAADPGAILDIAGRCPDPIPDPAELPLGRRGNIDRAIREWEGFRPDDLDELGTLVETIGAFAPRSCEAVDTGRLGGVVSAAVDPTVPRPIVVDRAVGELADLGPVELEPELDLPLWSFLATAQPDWLLPGIGLLEQHRVVGLATNPAFVEAMLAGANHQSTAELRFRNFPLRPRWSPLRKFWQRKGGDFDIEPIKSWPAGSPLGGPGLQPTGVGAEAVVLFRTPLFKRYPKTVVYLYKAGTPAADWTTPNQTNPNLVEAAKVFPTFTGKIGDDVVFFGFKVTPAELAHHWVVLEEPPTGFRFYTEDFHDAGPGNPDPPIQKAVDATSAADYAYETFAVPVRVMIAELIGAP